MTNEQLYNYLFPENEKPLDRIPEDGGFTAIFRKIACVGDSLSSGEFETKVPGRNTFYTDLYEYSWGQFIARMCGSEVLNFSRGGMTAKEYMQSFSYDRDLWNPSKKAQAYIVALGVNDVCNQGQPVGTIDDICLEDRTKNKDTFAGWYGQVIQKYKEIAPDAKFFFVTMMRGTDDYSNGLKQKHADVLYEMTKIFKNCYVVDLFNYAPVYDAEYCSYLNLEGHLNPAGYIFSAKMIAGYIDWIIRHNIRDFNRVGLINTELSDTEYFRMLDEAEKEAKEKAAK